MSGVKLTKAQIDIAKASVAHWRCNCFWPMAQKYTIGAHPKCQKCGLEIAPRPLLALPAGRLALSQRGGE